jgi:hypothetical protein
VIRFPSAALLLAVVCAGPAVASDPSAAAPAPSRRGPFPSREEWLPAQPLLTLPAVSPDPLPRGRSELRLDLDWGSDFGWEAAPGGRAKGILFMFDGEHRSATVSLRRGVSDAVTLGVHVPVLWRGAGFLDDIIDPFHRAFGFPDAGRPLFPADQFRVEAQRVGGGAVPVHLDPGTGLGAAEVEALWALRRRGPEPGFALGLVGRVLLPTGSGPFTRRAVDGAAQLAASRSLGGACDLYSGLGITWFGDSEFAGFSHGRTRPHGFLAFEWRPFRRWSLLAQGDLAGRLITGVARLPGAHAYLRLGARVDIARGFTLDAGFSEGIHALETTTDFGVQAGLSRRF